MKITTLVLASLAFVLMFAGTAGAQSPVNLSPWIQEGVTAGPNWALEPDGLSVLQTVNTPVPTFYVSPDAFINTTIRGKIGVQTTADDDFIGFVFGYTAPRLANEDNPSTNEFILFDWKQVAQLGAAAGFRLARVQGTHNNGNHNNNQFWNHVTDDNITFTQLGTPLVNAGWANNTLYDFELVYRPERIIISMQGGTGLFQDGAVIFDVLAADLPEGTFENNEFPVGAFGFYNLSQETVRYQNFTQEGQPVLQTNPASGGMLDFGFIRHGDDGLRDLTITNIGGIGSNLSGEVSGATTPFSGPSPGSDFFLELEAVEVKTFGFAPESRGSFLKSIDISSDGGSASISLSGVGVGPVFQSNPAPGDTLDLGLAASTSNAVASLMINNATPDTPTLDELVGLTLHSASISGTNADRFSLVSFSPGQVIAKDGSFDLQIEFSPGGESGPAEAQLTITTDAGVSFGQSGAEFTYELSGEAGFEVTAILSSGLGTIEPESQVVSPGADATLIIIPESGWHIDSVIGDTCAPEFQSGQTWIAPEINQNCAVEVVFLALPQLHRDPEQIVFVDRVAGPAVFSAVVTITNQGIGNLVIGQPELQGVAASEFSLVETETPCAGQTLGTDQVCTLQIDFFPLLDGRREATLVIPSNSPDQPHEVLLLAVTDQLFRDAFIAVE